MGLLIDAPMPGRHWRGPLGQLVVVSQYVAAEQGRAEFRRFSTNASPLESAYENGRCRHGGPSGAKGSYSDYPEKCRLDLPL